MCSGWSCGAPWSDLGPGPGSRGAGLREFKTMWPAGSGRHWPAGRRARDRCWRGSTAIPRALVPGGGACRARRKRAEGGEPRRAGASARGSLVTHPEAHLGERVPGQGGEYPDTVALADVAAVEHVRRIDHSDVTTSAEIGDEGGDHVWLRRHVRVQIT